MCLQPEIKTGLKLCGEVSVHGTKREFQHLHFVEPPHELSWNTLGSDPSPQIPKHTYRHEPWATIAININIIFYLCRAVSAVIEYMFTTHCGKYICISFPDASTMNIGSGHGSGYV